MCLYNAGKLKTAKKDITVFKHIIRSWNDHFITSFRRTEVSFGVLTTSHLIKTDDSHVHIGLHSFVDEKTAAIQAHSYDEVLVRCTIPKGSKYYSGKTEGFNGMVDSIASDQLIYNDIIKDYSLIVG